MVIFLSRCCRVCRVCYINPQADHSATYPLLKHQLEAHEVHLNWFIVNLTQSAPSVLTAATAET